MFQFPVLLPRITPGQALNSDLNSRSSSRVFQPIQPLDAYSRPSLPLIPDERLQDQSQGRIHAKTTGQVDEHHRFRVTMQSPRRCAPVVGGESTLMQLIRRWIAACSRSHGLPQHWSSSDHSTIFTNLTVQAARTYSHASIAGRVQLTVRGRLSWRLHSDLQAESLCNFCDCAERRVTFG